MNHLQIIKRTQVINSRYANLPFISTTQACTYLRSYSAMNTRVHHRNYILTCIARGEVLNHLDGVLTCAQKPTASFV